jgi:hypothetical protein
VERVNPDYPSPPGTPEQLSAIQDEIANLLAARAQAETAEATMDGEVQHHQSNQGPIQQAVQETAGAITAAQAHQQAVDRRKAANQEQQQRQQESQGLVAGYPSRAAGMTALTIPLGIFEGFTSYASELPGDFGQNMLRMNGDARHIQEAFAQMAVSMATQNDAQPARQQELSGDAGRLDGAAEQAVTSEQDLQTANDGAQGLEQANQSKIDEAVDSKNQCTAEKDELTTAADLKKQRAQTLTEQLQAWATAHKAARDAAIQATRERLTAQGMVVVDSPSK